MIARSQRLLANIQQLAPGITSRTAEIEADRRIPPDLVEALRSIGIFRMFVPQSHGGLELDMPAAGATFSLPCFRGTPTSRSTRMALM